jgi:hypothetical protein
MRGNLGQQSGIPSYPLKQHLFKVRCVCEWTMTDEHFVEDGTCRPHVCSRRDPAE